MFRSIVPKCFACFGIKICVEDFRSRKFKFYSTNLPTNRLLLATNLFFLLKFNKKNLL